jgi:hypothetical protein
MRGTAGQHADIKALADKVSRSATSPTTLLLKLRLTKFLRTVSPRPRANRSSLVSPKGVGFNYYMCYPHVTYQLSVRFIPLPKSNTPARILSNSELYDFELTPEDIGKLDALDRGKKGTFVNPKYYPANTP